MLATKQASRSSTQKKRPAKHHDKDKACDVWQADIEIARKLVAEWINKAIDEKFGNAVAAERATGISQTEFSRIRNGNLARYTVDRLVRLLGAIDKDVEVGLELKIRRRNRL